MSLSLFSAALLLTNACQVADAVRDRRFDAVFSLEGTVAVSRENSGIDLSFLLTDGANGVIFYDCVDEPHPHIPPAGTRVRISGDMVRTADRPLPLPAVRSVETRAAGPAPVPVPADARQLESGCYDNRPITLSGTIRDAYADETDLHAHFILLDCRGTVVPLVAYSPTDRTADLRKCIGRELTVSGLCLVRGGGRSVTSSRLVRLHDISEVERTAALRDPFDVPDASRAIGRTPAEIGAFGCCRLSGRVLATWQRRQALVESDGRLVRILLVEPYPPVVGSAIDVAGFATTDLHDFGLFNAVWRPSTVLADEPAGAHTRGAVLSSVRDLSGRARDGRRTFNSKVHGRPFRFRGTIRALARESGSLTLSVDGTMLDIDASVAPGRLNGLETDDTVEVTGLCIVDRENWSPQEPSPRTRGILLVVRTPADIRLVAHPSWWTRGRLLVALALLLGAVAAVSVWNVFLNRLVERRGRLLYRERIARDSADLRAAERTNLATELHDSLSQNLAAISCELAALRRTGARDCAAAIGRLPVLERMMQSCRTELRQCLYDLRGNLLDARDLATAIRLSLRQICDPNAFTLRLDLPSVRLHDTAKHAVIRIIRELVSNALRHGRATAIAIEGAADGGTFTCTVTDNGCGFDSARRPGPETGHFGLSGVESRLQGLHGSFSIVSQPGAGTRVTFTIPRSPEKRHA